MTLSIRPFAIALQYLGLLGAVGAIMTSYVARDSCYGPIYMQASIIAAIFDVLAISLAPRSTAIAFAVLKPIALFFLGFGVLISCAPPSPTYVEPPISAGVAVTIGLWSCLPTLLGAIGRRLAR